MILSSIKRFFAKGVNLIGTWLDKRDEIELLRSTSNFLRKEMKLGNIDAYSHYTIYHNNKCIGVVNPIKKLKKGDLRMMDVVIDNDHIYISKGELIEIK